MQDNRFLPSAARKTRLQRFVEWFAQLPAVGFSHEFIPDASRRPPPTPQDFGCVRRKFPFKVIQGNLSEAWKLQLCFLGRSGGILGKFGHLWMMLKLSRVMVIFSGFWRAMLDQLGGSNARIEATFWTQGQVWSSRALLKYLEATALLLGGRVGGS